MLWVCQGCTAAFSVGAPKCPQCGGLKFREQGDDEGPIRSAATGEPVRIVGEDGPELADLPAGAVAASAGKPRRKPDTAG